tara:strand:+ start:769 stop:1371 length:603 start_codon:yes stop_codon:yes gene_type:complete|mmetsp:Transcript_12355/g.46072  ORF Transcript_12355/g.46072 Transcript_12355/m.46072 type:complete len:201 (-) Transcript_12355:119-721(-)
MAMSQDRANASDREDLFTTVERLRDDKCVSRLVMADARAEAAALAATLKGREDMVGTLLQRLEDAEAKLARTRASARDAELATRRLGAPLPALAEDLWEVDAFRVAADGDGFATTSVVDPWGPRGDPRALTHEPEVAHRARQLVRLAGDLFDQECLLVAARTNARRGAKRSPFDPAWRDLETAGRAANSNPPGDDQRGVA